MTETQLDEIEKQAEVKNRAGLLSRTDQLLLVIKALREARVEVERLKRLSDTMQDIAEGDCAYGDNCPSNAGTRHGTCEACKARSALHKAGIPLRNCEVAP